MPMRRKSAAARDGNKREVAVAARSGRRSVTTAPNALYGDKSCACELHGSPLAVRHDRGGERASGLGLGLVQPTRSPGKGILASVERLGGRNSNRRGANRVAVHRGPDARWSEWNNDIRPYARSRNPVNRFRPVCRILIPVSPANSPSREHYQFGTVSVLLKTRCTMGWETCFRLGIVAAISLLATVVALVAQRGLGVWWFTIGLGPAVIISAALLYARFGRT